LIESSIRHGGGLTSSCINRGQEANWIAQCQYIVFFTQNYLSTHVPSTHEGFWKIDIRWTQTWYTRSRATNRFANSTSSSSSTTGIFDKDAAAGGDGSRRHAHVMRQSRNSQRTRHENTARSRQQESSPLIVATENSGATTTTTIDAVAIV
jgi:hypothetical protein